MDEHSISPYLDFGWQCSCGAHGLSPEGRADHLNLMEART